MWLFIMLFVLTACEKKENVDYKSEGDTAIDIIPTSPKSLETLTHSLCIKQEEIHSIFMGIVDIPGKGAYRNIAEIIANDEIKDSIQILNDIKVYQKNESFQYVGGDSPSAWVHFLDEKGDQIESIYFYEHILNYKGEVVENPIYENVLRYDGKWYGIDVSEYDRLQDIFSKYGKYKDGLSM